MNKLLLMIIAGYAGYKIGQYEQTALAKNNGWNDYNRYMPDWAKDEVIKLESEAIEKGRIEAGNDKDFIAARYNELFSDGE